MNPVPGFGPAGGWPVSEENDLMADLSITLLGMEESKYVLDWSGWGHPLEPWVDAELHVCGATLKEALECLDDVVADAREKIALLFAMADGSKQLREMLGGGQAK